jgi:ubiquitin-protein ligase
MVYLQKSAINRIISDIKQVLNPTFEENKIYYKHHDEDILQGYALIIGPEDTPYCYGNYLFSIKFPPNYPHSPPEFSFLIRDGITRFNPNLYKHGKVCLSILNTWKGEEWAATQSLSSILLSIKTFVFNDTPLLNEPGVTKHNQDYTAYNDIIYFKNYQIALLGVISKKYLPKSCDHFNDIIKENFISNYDNIIKHLNVLKKSDANKKTIDIRIYPASININYDIIIDRIEHQYKILEKL